jgi:selenide,water dikinase
MLNRAGVALLGGHTVTDPEVKFGYAVTGEVDPERVLTNAGARPGDIVILTKPLGTGIIVRARKYGQASDAFVAGATKAMLQLNDAAVTLAAALPARAVGACTDVTGFGLVGHSSEIASASDVTIDLDAAALPVLPGALELSVDYLPCGGRANKRHFQSLVVADGVAPQRHLVALDPQTSGGLLLTVLPEAVDRTLAHLASGGGRGWVIGRVESPDRGGIRVRLR